MEISVETKEFKYFNPNLQIDDFPEIKNYVEMLKLPLKVRKVKKLRKVLTLILIQFSQSNQVSIPVRHSSFKKIQFKPSWYTEHMNKTAIDILINNEIIKRIQTGYKTKHKSQPTIYEISDKISKKTFKPKKNNNKIITKKPITYIKIEDKKIKQKLLSPLLKEIYPQISTYIPKPIYKSINNLTHKYINNTNKYHPYHTQNSHKVELVEAILYRMELSSLLALESANRFFVNKLTVDGCKVPNPELHRVITYCKEGRNYRLTGARIYDSNEGNVQSLSKKTRKRIRICGEKTLELDYSSLHPNMAYAIKGVPVTEDPYLKVLNELGIDSKYREIAKVVNLVLFNAKGFSGAHGGVYNKIHKEKPQESKENKERRLENKRLYYEAKNQYGFEIKDWLHAFEKAHPEIKEFMFSGIGCEFQYVDSELIINVMRKLQEIDIYVYPIHDSVICQEKYKDIVEHVMYWEYYKMFNQGIKVK